MKSKIGQMTIFIIVAIVLVASVAGYFMFRSGLLQGNVPSTIEPVYKTFLSCIEENVYAGIETLESQAGYIEMPDFEAGSNYMPFSSQLDLLGSPVPYWYYVSGNNIEREQVPSKGEMESQLQDFIEGKMAKCDFESYREQGFEISPGEPKAKVSIDNSEVKVSLTMNLNIQKGDESAVIKSHKASVNSKLGTLYESAKNVYSEERENLFLENYGVDTLGLYAPVDGVEFSCSPKIWNAEDVFGELKDAIETNTLALTNQGNSDDYFVVEAGTSANVRFITSKNWANSFEVNPTDDVLMVASPVGNQPGLGILGFCYVPYHFVYNVKYPVLVQVSDGDETFQFPVAVIIQGNKPLESLTGSAVGMEVAELCEYKNNRMKIKTYDSKLSPVEAEISYECLGTKCNIGETTNGVLNENFPQCVNGYILARAEGFEDAKYLYSTTSPGDIDIVFDRIYERQVELKLDGKSTNKNALIYFISEKGSRTVVYPEQRKVKLSEGQYEIQVQVYANSSLELPKTTSQQCVDVSETGIRGFFGMTKEKCFDIETPSQIISNVLSGGGKENYYILESDLQNSGIVEINARGLPSVTTLEQLQNNYILFEQKDLDVNFK